MLSWKKINLSVPEQVISLKVTLLTLLQDTTLILHQDTQTLHSDDEKLNKLQASKQTEHQAPMHLIFTSVFDLFALCVIYVSTAL